MTARVAPYQHAAQLSGRFRAELFAYLACAVTCRELAAKASGRTRRHRIIDARNFITEAADQGAAAGHSGWRLP